MSRYVLRTALSLALLGSVAACSPDRTVPGGGARDDAKAAVAQYRSTTARAVAASALRHEKAHRARTAAARAWGLSQAPLLPPSPPRTKPRLVTEPGFEAGDGGYGLPPVITRVPTSDPVVFLTIDDGAAKDPRLPRMLRELDVPVSSFLADYVAGDDYDYFRGLRGGAAVHNHTLDHPDLRELPYEAQRRQICGQQQILARETGTRPRLFRPPYGHYNGDTLRAAASCGIEVVPLWQQEAFPGRMTYRRAERELRPGDIILTHFRGPDEWPGTMTDVLRGVLRMANEQGLAIARLEDYV